MFEVDESNSCLVGCEESQEITLALRAEGVDAWSCDLKPCTGGHPEIHLQMDVFKAMQLRKWTFGIFHPPCTFTTNSSIQWLSHPEDTHLPFHKRRPHPLYPDRRERMEEALYFAKEIYYNKYINKLGLENPIGLLSTLWKKPDQIIQPYHFGDEFTKSTCLWLRNLPKLRATKIVSSGERIKLKSGKSMPKWYADAKNWNKSKEETQTIRSKTFPGMAAAIAKQWPGVEPLTLF